MKKILFGAALAACLAPLGGWAIDASDLVFPVDYPHGVRREVVFENVRRRVDVTANSLGKETGMEANVFALRFHTAIIPGARMDFDLGTLGSSRGSYALLAGFGLRYLAFDYGPWRCGAFGQARFASKASDKMNLPNVGDADVKHDWLEADLGALASYRVRVADRLALAPYAGPILSVLRLSGDIQETGFDGKLKAEANQIIGAVVGVAAEFNGANGIRLEMQFFDEVSFSVGATYVF